jgi:hypothetical protein
MSQFRPATEEGSPETIASGDNGWKRISVAKKEDAPIDIAQKWPSIFTSGNTIDLPTLKRKASLSLDFV